LQHKSNKFFITKDSTLASTTQEKHCLKTPITRHYPYFFRLKAAYPMSIDAQKLAVFTEEIIEEINEGNCDFSIDYLKNIHANSIFHKNIDYSVVLSTSNSLHWICKKRNDSLLTHINAWMNRFKQTPSYTFLLKKYYDPSSTTRKSILYHKNHPTLQQISPYDEIIEKYATKYQFDWLLVVALMYQESKFHVHTTGKGGSYGLMQFMPATANRWGLNIGDSPEKQIKAGCEYLYFLKQKYIKMGVTDTNDLIKFILASYNAGSCRIEDARKLAKLQGLDENKWDNHVEVALQIFSKRKAKIKMQLRCNRFYRADRTLQYIDEVLHRYQHYKNSKVVYKNTKIET
ncbi:MAG: transglycosylase SLT domain-containing protein, partial [Bacteroidales bacterium]|nr:transglycosylase SLT domain-containing protein [Bacteroidales bacterium]